MSDPLSIFRNPPSRGSINDAAYDPALGQNIEIRLDGYLQDKVIAYDCDAGFIERYAVDRAGNIRVEGGEAVVETVNGDVFVCWKRKP